MEILRRIFTIMIILILLISVFLFLGENYTYAISQTISSDINSLNDSEYPGIKSMIQSLKSQYPNWNFKILYTDLDWNEVISGEYQGHGGSPKNLVQYSNNYKGAWICPICGENRPYDNGSWRCASEQAIAYMMDPRNSLNTSDIFQFEELTNPGCDINTVRSMTQGTFLQGHEQGIVDTANSYGVNGYYIVARLIQEQGKNGSALVSGQSGYYNAFNIGATGGSEAEVIANGLAYAQKKGWTTLEASIQGGISFVADNYIKKGQNTLYLQKFNVTTNSGGPYNHQYQQNILAAQSEGTTLRNTYININSLSSSHTFIIPVYKNMPQQASPRPDGSQGATVTSDIVKVNVENSLRLRNEPNGGTTVGWLWKDEIVTRIEKATTKIGGTYWDKVRKSDGTIGYAARETYDNESPYKLYLVPIDSGGNNGENPSTSETPGDNTGGNEGTENPDVNYLNGDVNNDGKITSSDYVLIKNSIMGTISLDERQQKAADVNHDGKVSSSDYVMIKNYIMGTITSL